MIVIEMHIRIDLPEEPMSLLLMENKGSQQMDYRGPGILSEK